MANPKWGGKHTCQHCGVKYYDLNRSPIVCPKCGAQFNPDALLRSRRSKPTPPDKAAAPQAAAVAPTAKEDDGKADDGKADDQLEAENLVTAKVDDDADKLGEDNEKDKLIEDVSELGEDEDDIAEVRVEGDEPKDT